MNNLKKEHQWIVRTLHNFTKSMNLKEGKFINGTSSCRFHTAIKWNDYYFLMFNIILIFLCTITHFIILETRKIPKVATPVPIIKVFPFFCQKFFPYWITYLVSALISCAAFDKSCLKSYLDYFTSLSFDSVLLA